MVLAGDAFLYVRLNCCDYDQKMDLRALEHCMVWVTMDVVGQFMVSGSRHNNAVSA